MPQEEKTAEDVLKETIGEIRWYLDVRVTKDQLIWAMNEFRKPLTARVEELTRENEELKTDLRRERRDVEVRIKTHESLMKEREEENARLTERLKAYEESQQSKRTCATGCDWPNCTLEGCVDPKCDC